MKKSLVCDIIFISQIEALSYESFLYTLNQGVDQRKYLK